MAVIAPFNGLFYNTTILGGLDKLVAPPYDVINEEEQESYYQTHPNNVIRLILGKKKTGDSDWDNRYTRSADYFRRWRSEDVLISSDQLAMYMTSLSYDLKDGSGLRTRWGLIALVRIEDEETGVILPHEKTFSAHKDDRLKLMRACRAQFSQIFGLYEDNENQVFDCFKDAIAAPPLFSFDFRDGTSHKMWTIRDPYVFNRVAEVMSQKSIFIADGHHRYETSRNFRNIMRARYGRRPRNRSYEYVIMYLSNMDDPGLIILPSHRLIKRCEGFKLESFLESIKEWFEIIPIHFSEGDNALDLRNLKSQLADHGQEKTVFGFYPQGTMTCYLLIFKPDAANILLKDLEPSLKKLDVLVLSRFILQKGLGFTKTSLDDEGIFHYYSDIGKTVSLVDSGEYQMAFLLNPTKMKQVKEIARNGLIMPRKSTFFYPKILTGMVFNKIDPYELIQEP